MLFILYSRLLDCHVHFLSLYLFGIMIGIDTTIITLNVIITFVLIFIAGSKTTTHFNGICCKMKSDYEILFL